MPRPLVSVLLPVCNAAATVARAVESIRRQTFTDWELIAVDDGSTDGTAGVLKELSRVEPRLRVFTRPHEGIVSALNAGLAETRSGALIARMDADDESFPERLSEQFAFLRQHPEIGVVGSLVEFGGEAAQAGYALHVDWINGIVTEEAIALNRFAEAPFAHPSVMFRRALVAAYGGYRDGDFPEDYELWLRWLEAGVRMAKVPRVLLRWHDPPARLSRTAARYNVAAFYRCKAPYLARWLRQHVAASRRILVWGAGRPTRQRAALVEAQGVEVAGYVDIDPKKRGRVLGTRRVIAPEELPPASEVFVIGYVAKRGARELARGILGGRGFVEGRDFLIAA